MKQDIGDKVLQIVKKISGHIIDNIDPDKDIRTQLILDSIQLVELFAALEIEFNIELPLEMMNVKNAKEFIDRLEIELNKKETIKTRL